MIPAERSLATIAAQLKRIADCIQPENIEAQIETEVRMTPDPTLPTTPLDPQALPKVEAKLQEIAASPPTDPLVQSKIADVMTFVQKLCEMALANPSINAMLSPTLKSWIITAVAVIPMLIAAGLFGRYVVPAIPPTPAPIVVPDKPEPKPEPKPPIVVPVAQLNTLVIYRTAELDAKGLASLSTIVNLSIDPATYKVGSTYPFGDRSIPLPCAALVSKDGRVIDVAPFTPATAVSDLAAFIARNKSP